MALELYPLITAAITCYNAADTIGAAIESAIGQDWPNLEVLVLDDASTDGSVEIVQAFAISDPRIRLIRHDINQGVAAARNGLIAEARGEFVAFFDDDDVSLPTRITRQYERITHYERQYPTGPIVCHTARLQKFADGRTRYERTMGTASGPAPNGEAVIDRGLFGKLSRGVIGSCATCSQMARRALYIQLDGFDASFRRCEDSDFQFRVAMVGGSFVGVAEALVIQRMTGGDEKTIDALHAAAVQLFEKYRHYLDRKNWSSFCRVWLEARAAYFAHRRARLMWLLAGLAVRHPIKVMLRMYWSLPARHTRRAMRGWCHGAYDVRMSPDKDS